MVARSATRDFERATFLLQKEDIDGVGAGAGADGGGSDHGTMSNKVMSKTSRGQKVTSKRKWRKDHQLMTSREGAAPSRVRGG